MKILIVGAGDVGFDIVNRLAGEDHDLTIIDKDPERCEWVSDQFDVITVVGDGSDIEVLQGAGIGVVDLIIGVTKVDNTNLIVCMLGHQLGVPKKVARIRGYNPNMKENFELLSKTTGIDALINPVEETADEIFELFEHSGATEIIKFANGRIQLVGARLTKGSPIIGKSLSELAKDMGKRSFVLTALTRNGRTIIPRGDTEINENDLAFLMGERTSVASLLTMIGKRERKVAKVMIIGGGSIGFNVAKMLENMKVSVIIIEMDKNRCLELANQLKKTLVLTGNGTDTKLLVSEEIDKVDHLVAATGDEETNVIVSLLAKQYNPECTTVCLVKRPEYVPILLKIGIDAAISPRSVTINAIMKFIRKGEIVSVATLNENDAEIIEIVATENSKVVDKPLQKLKFPQDAIIGSIVRGENIIIPTGESLIHPGDRIVIFALHSAIEGIEKLFAREVKKKDITGLGPLLKSVLAPTNKNASS